MIENYCSIYEIGTKPYIINYGDRKQVKYARTSDNRMERIMA
jgi:hypothetical protein